MSAAADHDRRVLLREFIHECMGFASVYAGLVQTYAELGDDLGLESSLRKFVALARQSAATFNDLRQVGAAGAPLATPEAAE